MGNGQRWGWTGRQGLGGPRHLVCPAEGFTLNPAGSGEPALPLPLILKTSRPVLQRSPLVGLLTLGQHGSEMRGSTYAWTFFNSKYYV